MSAGRWLLAGGTALAILAGAAMLRRRNPGPFPDRCRIRPPPGPCRCPPFARRRAMSRRPIGRRDWHRRNFPVT
ncbi:MAG TPA: hypothetical protein PLL33_13045, partial [Paracoccus sp. (in: a-proteobacteria)]|nr:hypothetical protein [Paracoccus sp. (in: a-proteobacteria)]